MDVAIDMPIRGKMMNTVIKQKFQALFYVAAIVAAVYVTGCRSNTNSGGGGNTGGILPPSSVAAQFTTAGEAGETGLSADAPVIKVSWTNPSYTAAEFTVQLEYKKANDASYESVEVGTETSHVISADIDQTQDYNFRLKATTEDGDASDYAMTNLYASGGGGGGEDCPVATGLSATVINVSNVQVQWSWNSSDYAEMSSYKIQRKAQSATDWTNISTQTGFGTPATSHSDMSPIGGPIHYRVVTVCDSNDHPSSASNVVTAFTNLAVPTGLSTPVYYSSTVEYLDWANYTGGPFNQANGYIGMQIESTVIGFGPTYHSTSNSQSQIYFTPTNCADGLTVEYRIRALAYNGVAFNSNWSTPIQTFCP